MLIFGKFYLHMEGKSVYSIVVCYGVYFFERLWIMKYILLFIKKTLRFVLKPLSFVPAILVMYMIFRPKHKQNPFSTSGLDSVSNDQ